MDRLVTCSSRLIFSIMPSKRSRPSASPLSDGGVSSDIEGPSKRARAYSASPTVDIQGSVDQYPLRVYIIPAKLSPSELENLASLVGKNATQQGNKTGARILALAPDLDHVDAIVTAVHTRPRLERHVCWEVAVREPSHVLHTGC